MLWTIYEVVMIKIVIAVEENQVNKLNFEYKDITLSDVADELNLDKLKIGAVLVNGIPKKTTEKIEDNSEFYLLPILSGG